MKKGIIFLAATIQLALYGCANKMEVTVSNPTDCDRLQEMVEIRKRSVNEKLGLSQDDTFVVTNGRKEVPYQITWEGNIIFPVTLSANESQTFKIRKGTPTEVVTKVCGKHYPERVDDICWESDLADSVCTDSRRTSLQDMTSSPRETQTFLSSTRCTRLLLTLRRKRSALSLKW